MVGERGRSQGHGHGRKKDTGTGGAGKAQVTDDGEEGTRDVGRRTQA